MARLRTAARVWILKFSGDQTSNTGEGVDIEFSGGQASNTEWEGGRGVGGEGGGVFCHG